MRMFDLQRSFRVRKSSKQNKAMGYLPFNISVYDHLIMKISKTLKDLFYVEGGQFFRKCSKIRENFANGALLDILQYKILGEIGNRSL